SIQKAHTNPFSVVRNYWQRGHYLELIDNKSTGLPDKVAQRSSRPINIESGMKTSAKTRSGI
ncbi:MAG: hypothetical protein AAFO91_20165, partial [Bacteroidota bacterium]